MTDVALRFDIIKAPFESTNNLANYNQIVYNMYILIYTYIQKTYPIKNVLIFTPFEIKHVDYPTQKSK